MFLLLICLIQIDKWTVVFGTGHADLRLHLFHSTITLFFFNAILFLFASDHLHGLLAEDASTFRSNEEFVDSIVLLLAYCALELCLDESSSLRCVDWECVTGELMNMSKLVRDLLLE